MKTPNFTLVLIGESGTGKTTFANYLKNQFDITLIKPYTTRILEENEKNDYVKVDDDMFENIETRNNTFASFSHYRKIENGEERTVWYGIADADIRKNGIKVVVSNFAEAEELLRTRPNIVVVDMDIIAYEAGLSSPESVYADIFERILDRNRDSLDEIIRRSIDEKEARVKFEKFAGNAPVNNWINEKSTILRLRSATGYLSREDKLAQIVMGLSMMPSKGRKFVGLE